MSRILREFKRRRRLSLQTAENFQYFATIADADDNISVTAEDDDNDHTTMGDIKHFAAIADHNYNVSVTAEDDDDQAT